MIGLWYAGAMKRRSIVGYLLALFAISGFALAPMVRPAMAMSVAKHASMIMDAASMAPSTMDDMPCCPGKPADCGKDCPFMALCGGMPLQGVSQTSLIIPLTLLSVIFPTGESGLASVAQPPPRKPPKI
jgi:hypothetical protein